MQKKFATDLGKTLAGTLIYLLGYGLAEAGIISGGNDKDKDVAAFERNILGVQPYSFKIGDKSFTYDWASPIASPLAIMADVKKQKPDGIFNTLLLALETGGQTLLNQSFLESFKTIFNSQNGGLMEGLKEAGLDLPSRAIPTLFKQIADIIDPTARTTFDYNSDMNTALNKVKSKIPFASKTLQPVIDTMGRETKKYGEDNNFFNVFLNPANVNKKQENKSAEEIFRLYKQTGDKTIFPRVAPYYTTLKNEKIDFLPEQKSQFQKISGKVADELITKSINNTLYKKLSDDEKSSSIKKIVDYSFATAKEKVTRRSSTDTEYNSNKKAIENGVKAENLFIYKTVTSKMENDKDKNGNTIKNSKKVKVISFILKSDMSEKEKSYLYSKEFTDTKSIINAKIPIDEYLKLQKNIAFIEGTEDKRSNIEGKTISGSLKRKVLQEIVKLDATPMQKILLTYLSGYSIEDTDYKGVTKRSARKQTFNYIDDLEITRTEKEELLKKTGYKKLKNGKWSW